MKNPRIICLTLAVCLGLPVATAPAQIGQRIDRALERVGEGLREGWDEARGAVNRMGLQARVYSRVHWDRELHDSAIEIDSRSPDIVVLRGTVPDEAAKRKAVELARDTVGVASVIDELAIAPPAADTPPNTERPAR